MPRQVLCSECGQPGHNTASCPNPQIEERPVTIEHVIPEHLIRSRKFISEGEIICPRKGQMAIQRCLQYQQTTQADGQSCRCPTFEAFPHKFPDVKPDDVGQSVPRLRKQRSKLFVIG